MRIPQIQALRAFAATLVVVYHAGITSGGYIGVDIFYVISGYLITGLLLRELDKTGTLGLKAFLSTSHQATLAYIFLCPLCDRSNCLVSISGDNACRSG